MIGPEAPGIAPTGPFRGGPPDRGLKPQAARFRIYKVEIDANENETVVEKSSPAAIPRSCGAPPSQIERPPLFRSGNGEVLSLEGSSLSAGLASQNRLSTPPPIPLPTMMAGTTAFQTVL